MIDHRMTKTQIDEAYTPRQPQNTEQQTLYAAGKSLAQAIAEHCPDVHLRARALDAVEEAVAFADMAILRTADAPTAQGGPDHVVGKDVKGGPASHNHDRP